MTLVNRYCIVALLTLIFAGLAWSGQSGADPGSIKWYAEQAKQKGETSLTIRGPQGMHEKITSLDEALSTYSVAVGFPVDSFTQLIDNFHVYTWYKIRILERLIVHANPEVPPVSIPDAMKPVKANEIVIRIPEGSVTIDGVRVTVTDEAVHLLSINERYLFFLSPDSSGQFAFLRAGVNSVFTIKADNKVAPLVSRVQSRMQEDLDASTGGSLDKIRSFAKAKASERLPNN